MSEKLSINDRIAKRLKESGDVKDAYKEPTAYAAALGIAESAVGGTLQGLNSALDSATAGMYGYGVNLLGGAVEYARSNLMDETPVSFGEAYTKIQQSRARSRERFAAPALAGDIAGAIVGGGKVAKALEATIPAMKAGGSLGAVTRPTVAGAGGGLSEANKAGNLGQDVVQAGKLGAAGGFAGQAIIGETMIPLLNKMYESGVPAIRSVIGGPYAEVGDATPGQRIMQEASDRNAAKSLAPGGIFSKAFDSSEGISRDALLDMAQRTVPGQTIMADMDPRLSNYAATLAARPAAAGRTSKLDEIATDRLDTVEDRAAWFMDKFVAPSKTQAESIKSYTERRQELGKQFEEVVDTAPNLFNKREVREWVEDAFSGPQMQSVAARGREILAYIDSKDLEPTTHGTEQYFSARAMVELRKSLQADIDTPKFGEKVPTADERRKITQITKRITKQLNESVEGFDEVNSAFADDILAERARRMAKEHMTADPKKVSNSEVLKELNDLTPAAKQEYMLGLSQHLSEVINARGAEAFIKKLSKPTVESARLKVILGDETFTKMREGADQLIEAADRAKSWKKALERRELHDEPAKGLLQMIDQLSIASTLGTGQLFSTRAMVPARRLIREQDQVAIASLLDLVQSSGDEAVNLVNRITKDRTSPPTTRSGAVGATLLDEALRPQ